MLLTPEDRAQIESAIAEAETKTSGEIRCIAADEVSAYPEIPVAWAAIAAALLPALALTIAPDSIFGGWRAAHTAALDAAIIEAVMGFALVQALIFLAVMLIVRQPQVRR